MYRLPTEAEWEYAARAGSVTPFHFGEIADPSMGNFQGSYPFDEQRKSKVEGHYGTRPVGSYVANAFGLYDMHGNVREFTADTYHARLPGKSLVDPRPRTEGRRITVRGGSWEDYARHVRSAWRVEVGVDTVSASLGFRVCLLYTSDAADE